MVKGSLHFILMLSALALAGCKSSVSVQPGPIPVEPLTPVVSAPTLVLPQQSIHYSGDSQLHIAGFCVPGNKVILSGDASMETSCVDSMYAFFVPKAVDGVYTFHITQVLYGRTSNPLPVTWIRQTSTAPPALTFPSKNPFHSAQSVLTITGNCQSGSEIYLGMDASGSTTCTNSAFTLAVPKFSDGSYNIKVTQKDRSGNTADIDFVWEKSKLTVSPENPQIQVDSDQQLTLGGGSLEYVMTLVENQSGASLDPVTRTYRAGTIAGVVDKISIEDTLGAYREVEVEVVPGSADHMLLPADSGDGQIGPMGQISGQAVKGRVVDRFGNGVGAVPVVFQVATGDAQIMGSPLKSTDAQGYAEVLVKLGYVSTKSTISVVPNGVVLPNLATTGSTMLFMDLTSQHTNSGNLGLSFYVGDVANSLLTGDFNSDGEVDVIVLNAVGTTPAASVGFLRGLGNGLFAAMVEIRPICTSPNAIVSGDFNGDSFLDIIISCPADSSLMLLAGNGDGTFVPAVTVPLDPAESLPVALVAGELNGDGILDLAVLSASNNTMGVRMGIGDGTFLAPTVLLTNSGPSAVVVADVDGQNGNDLIVLNSGDDSFGVYLNDGSGSMAASVDYGTVAAPADLIAADFNGDLFPDLAIVGATDEVVSVILNDQTGVFDSSNDISVPVGPIKAEVLDLDSDGILDIVVTGVHDGTLTSLRGIGNGTFEPGQTQLVLSNPLGVATGDFNGDTRSDVVVLSMAERKIQVLPSQGAVMPGLQSSLGPNPVHVTTGDFNGDNLLDLVVLERGTSTAKILHSTGLGTFQAGPTVSTSANPVGTIAADFNGDGLLDLAIALETSNAVAVFINNGVGGFHTPVSYGVGNQPTSVIAKDINRDGILDLLVTNGGSSSVSIYPGVGDGTFGIRSDVGTGAQPVALRVADLNQDGALDLAVANMSGGNVSVILGNGDGTFQGQTLYEAQAGSNSVVIGYFGPDKFPDIAVANEFTSTISVFKGNGDGSFQNPLVYGTSSIPTQLLKIDVNGDGYDDLLTGSKDSQWGKYLTVHYGNFSGDFSAQQQIMVPFIPQLLEPVDLMGKGGLDLVVLDNISEKLWVLIGH